MTSKILVVDDEPDLEVLMLQRFRRSIRKGEYAFTFARDGVEALEVLKADSDIDIVLLDINMPRMDGLTLLGHLDGVSPLLRAVIVSAYGDMGNIRTAMNRGAFDFVTKPINFDDLQVTIDKTITDVAVLREAFDDRAAAERARANLSRYFPPSIVETLANTDEPFGPARVQDVAVLFADIIGFTTLSAEQTPETVFDLLRKVLGELGAEVFAHAGTLDKYFGDGLMATFGTPSNGPLDATNALKCARGMQERINGVNQDRAVPIRDSLKIAVGVHYGPVLLGNIGEARRLEFAVIGDTVNVANRLEEMARPLEVGIVISGSLVEAIKRENDDNYPDLARLTAHGSHRLRGRDEEVDVWTVNNL
jgi:adenylate cyclase